MRQFNKLLDYLAIFSLSGMFILILIQVVMRYVFDMPLIWSEELARICLVWVAFIGAIIGMREGRHIDITVVVDNVPVKARKYIMFLSKAISSTFLVALTYYGVGFVAMNMTQASPVLNITMGVVYLCLPLASVGMLYFLLFPQRRV